MNAEQEMRNPAPEHSSSSRGAAWRLQLGFALFFAAYAASCATVGYASLRRVETLLILLLPMPLFLAFLWARFVLGSSKLLRLACSGLISLVFLYALRSQTDLIQFNSSPWKAGFIFLLLLLFIFALPVAQATFALKKSLLVLGAALSITIGYVSLINSFGNVRDFVFLRHRFLATIVHHVSGAEFETIQQIMQESGVDRRTIESYHASVMSSEGRELPAQDSQEPRIVVLALVDTLRADSLAFWGGDPSWMPRINRIADRSLVFDDVVTNATWTRPAVAALFTGLLPEQAGVFDSRDRLPDALLTVAEGMRELGYSTIGFSTNPHVSERTGFDQGFDEFEQIRGGDAGRAAGIVHRALERLDQADDDELLFVYVHFMDPHTPYFTDERRVSFRQYHRGSYISELGYLDQHLAEFVIELEAKFSDHLFFIMVSDHGEEFGEHGNFGHGQSIYPEVYRVPAIIYNPRIVHEIMSDSLELRDFYNITLGVAISGVQFRLTDVVEKSKTTRSISTYKTPRSATYRSLFPFDVIRIRAVEDGEWLYIENSFGDTKEVYHLESDPEARDNLLRLNAARAVNLERRMNDNLGFWTSSSEPEVVMTREEEERLRALGYVQ